jgi:hypothetical protein
MPVDKQSLEHQQRRVIQANREHRKHLAREEEEECRRAGVAAEQAREDKRIVGEVLERRACVREELSRKKGLKRTHSSNKKYWQQVNRTREYFKEVAEPCLVSQLEMPGFCNTR